MLNPSTLELLARARMADDGRPLRRRPVSAGRPRRLSSATLHLVNIHNLFRTVRRAARVRPA